MFRDTESGSTTEIVQDCGSEDTNTLLTWENTASDSLFRVLRHECG